MDLTVTHATQLPQAHTAIFSCKVVFWYHKFYTEALGNLRCLGVPLQCFPHRLIHWFPTKHIAGTQLDGKSTIYHVFVGGQMTHRQPCHLCMINGHIPFVVLFVKAQCDHVLYDLKMEFPSLEARSRANRILTISMCDIQKAARDPLPFRKLSWCS